MANKDIIVTFAPYSEEDLQRAKKIFNGYIVKKVTSFFAENFPPEEQDYIRDEYIKFLTKKIEAKKAKENAL